MGFAFIAALKQHKGNSWHTIAKYIKEHNKANENFEIYFRKALSKSVTDGALIQASGIRASGSFKTPRVEKKSVIIFISE